MIMLGIEVLGISEVTQHLVALNHQLYMGISSCRELKQLSHITDWCTLPVSLAKGALKVKGEICLQGLFSSFNQVPTMAV